MTASLRGATRSDPAMAERKQLSSDFEHVAEHLEHMWDHLLKGGGPGSPRYARPMIEPPTDVYHTESEIVVLVEIAGMREEEVEIQLEGRRMTVRGEKRDRRARQPGRNYHAMEIQYGPFERAIVVPLMTADDPDVRAVDDAVTSGHRIVAVVAQQPDAEGNYTGELRQVGTAAQILRMAKAPNGTLQALIQGIARVRILEVEQQ